MPAIKTQTKNGKPYARFTMVVEFKEEYRRANEDTGEVYTRWTYRSDLENMKLLKERGIEYTRALDVLGFIYNRDRHKYHTVKIYDNEKAPGEQLLYEEIKGKVSFPIEKDRQQKFISWVKSIL